MGDSKTERFIIRRREDDEVFEVFDTLKNVVMDEARSYALAEVCLQYIRRLWGIEGDGEKVN